MAREPQPAEEREKRIKFKENLIDFEAPADDETDGATPRSPSNSEPTEISRESPKEEQAVSGANVLVEKEGRFELVNENDVHGERESKSSGSESIEDMLKLNEERPVRADNEMENRSSASRPVSAPSTKSSRTYSNTFQQPTYYNPPPRPKSAGSGKLMRFLSSSAFLA